MLVRTVLAHDLARGAYGKMCEMLDRGISLFPRLVCVGDSGRPLAKPQPPTSGLITSSDIVIDASNLCISPEPNVSGQLD